MRLKHIFLIFLGVSVLSITCAKKDEHAVTFTVGGAPNEIDFWHQLVRDFESKSGVRVEIIRQPTDTDQRRQGLVVSLNSGMADPDIFLLDVAWLGQFAASGWLEPLNHCLEHGTIKPENFFGRIIDEVDTYGGTVMAFPVYVDGGLLYYRKDLLEKYGLDSPPQTWDELIDHSLRIQKRERINNPDFYGFVWQGAQYEGLICNFLEFASSNDGAIRLKEGRIDLDLPENIEALNLMKNLIHEHKISPPNTYTEMKEEEVRNFFQQGNALFERNWPYAWALHQGEKSPVKDIVGIAPLPHFISGPSVSTLGGWHVGISKFADKKAEALELMKFILSYETQMKLAIGLGWNPARKDVYADKEVLRKMPHFSYLREVFEKLVARPNLPYYTQISEVMQRYINGALAGEFSAEEALAKAEEEAQKVVDRYEKH
jgi:multiple sugar transport system substrate-binding protein